MTCNRYTSATNPKSGGSSVTICNIFYYYNKFIKFAVQLIAM